jgi:hypothetical protein
VQIRRKEDYDRKIPTDHGIWEQGLVLLYDNRHKEFPGKLYTRWMGPYGVCQIFPNGSVQLKNLQRQWLDTRVNGSRVKKKTKLIFIEKLKFYFFILRVRNPAVS